jgi:hypothetical protein
MYAITDGSFLGIWPPSMYRFLRKLLLAPANPFYEVVPSPHWGMLHGTLNGSNADGMANIKFGGVSVIASHVVRD